MCKTNLREYQDWPKCCFLNTVKCKKWIHLKINIYSVIHQFLTCWCDQIKMEYVSKHAIKASQHWTFTESETNVESWLYVCTQLQLLFRYSYESGIVLALILSSGMKTTVWSSFIPCLPSFCTFCAAHQQSALVHSQLFIYFFVISPSNRWTCCPSLVQLEFSSCFLCMVSDCLLTLNHLVPLCWIIKS